MSGSDDVAGGDTCIKLDEKWLESINLRVKKSQIRYGDRRSCTIFRVPHSIRKSDVTAYEPRVVSLGPYHCNNENLRAMDKIKWRYLGEFLHRNRDQELEHYLSYLKKEEPRARSCYLVDEDEIDSDRFIEVMLLDGSFIVEYLLMIEEGKMDPAISSMSVANLIPIDMMLLENQIPFFILENLFNLVVSPNPRGLSLTNLALKYVLPVSGMRIPSHEGFIEVHHFLHLLHSCLLSYVPRPARQDESIAATAQVSLQLNLLRAIPCASSLQEAGIRFRKKENSSFLNVTFRRGVMEMPPLCIDDDTGALVRSLIAFEQCYSKSEKHVTGYAVLMDCLVDTAADVTLLHHHGVVVNELGSNEEAALLINQLCKEVVVDYEESYLASLFQDVNTYSRSSVPKWRAKLAHDYFSSPWAFLSLMGALILLGLTIIQTVYAVLSYNSV